MKWKKLGKVFGPEDSAPEVKWIHTHAQNPFPEYLGNDRYRIHVACRDENNMARGAYVDIDIKDPTQVLDYTREPTLDHGELGCFDDCGIMPSCIVDHQDKRYMYYTGWTQARRTPFSFFIGLMISEDGGQTYQRYSQAPVLGRSFHDPYLTCSPWVTIEDGVWKMWYTSGTGWGGTYQLKDIPGAPVKTKHFYHIKYAWSEDGIHWNNEGHKCIDYGPEEYAIARSTVYRDEGLYKMNYSYRGGENTYRAGYAESRDGLDWTRKDDEVGIDVSAEGWDQNMICYPCRFKHGEQEYLLYNGNNYGETGFGIAIRES